MEWGLWILLIVTIVVMEVFWICQFVRLMALSDDDFPGRHDKVLWCLAFIATNVIAAIALPCWQNVMLQVRSEEREAGQRPDGGPTA